MSQAFAASRLSPAQSADRGSAGATLYDALRALGAAVYARLEGGGLGADRQRPHPTRGAANRHAPVNHGPDTGGRSTFSIIARGPGRPLARKNRAEKKSLADGGWGDDAAWRAERAREINDRLSGVRVPGGDAFRRDADEQTLARETARVNFERHRVEKIITKVWGTLRVMPTIRSDGFIYLRREGSITETDLNELAHYAARGTGRRP